MRNASLLSLLVLGGCAGLTPAQVAPPPEITVERAFEDVGNGMSNFRELLLARGTYLGMIVCRIEVNFNISARATESGKAGIEITVPLQGATIGANASRASEATGNRGNNVLVILQSIRPDLCVQPSANTPAKTQTTSETPAVTPAATTNPNARTNPPITQSPPPSTVPPPPSWVPFSTNPPGHSR